MFWKPKKDISLWISAINSAISGEEIKEELLPEKKDKKRWFGSKNENVQVKTETVRMNFCPNCGTKLVENAKFCHSCGLKIS